MARLRDSELFSTLIEAIFSFEVAGRSAVLQARQALAETTAWLHERRQHWAAEQARLTAALNACLASEESTGCDLIATAREAAAAELATAERWLAEVDRAAATYHANEPRFQDVLDQRCAAARGYLTAKLGVVQGYEGAAGSAGGAGYHSPASPSGQTASAPALSSYTTNGRAFSNVPVSQIEEPSFGPGEFQQADVRDMQRSFALLPQLQGAIQNGTIDRVIAANPAAKRAYDWFYGGEAIKIEWQQGKFAINNGKHRVQLARMLGVSHLPTQIGGRP